MIKILAVVAVLAFGVIGVGLAQQGTPVLKECEPGQGPLPQPPPSAGCVSSICSTATCFQPGAEINMQPGDCVNTWPTPCKYTYGPLDYYHWYTCVNDYSCEDPEEFRCKWQVVAGSGFQTKLLTCYNQ